MQHQLEQSKLLYKRQLAECRQQEHFLGNLTKQHDALRTQHEAFLEQVGSAATRPALGRGHPLSDAQGEDGLTCQGGGGGGGGGLRCGPSGDPGER